MKRMLAYIALAAAMSVGTAEAQYSSYYYHRVGDTIEWRSEIGYYSWWEFQRFYEENLTLGFSMMPIDVLYYFDYGGVDSNVLLQINY